MQSSHTGMDLCRNSELNFTVTLATTASSDHFSSGQQSQRSYQTPLIDGQDIYKDDYKRFKCSQCPYRTHYQHHLTRHNRVHTREFFQCHLCRCHFSEKYELEYHMQAHSGQLVCKVCGKKFSSKSGIYEHKKTHQREKQFVNVCQALE